jgi:hypothetical protein
MDQFYKATLIESLLLGVDHLSTEELIGYIKSLSKEDIPFNLRIKLNKAIRTALEPKRRAEVAEVNLVLRKFFKYNRHGNA